MAAFKVPLKIDRGASYSKLATWKVGKPPEPVDLTGCTALAQVRAAQDAPDILHAFSSTGANVILGGAAGTIELLMSDEETAEAAWKSGVYDLIITFPDGSKRRLMSGTVTLTPGVTRG